MRDEFKNIIDKVIDEGLVNIIIDRDDEGRVHITLSQPFLLKTGGSLFLLPSKTPLMVDDQGIYIREFSECKQCDNKDTCTSPIGTEDELMEYLDKMDKYLNSEVINTETAEAIDMSIFKNHGGSC